MKITERTIKFLGRTLCGDTDLLPYKSGPKLVDFFVGHGADDRYGEGFPSRWQYTEDKIRQFNNTPTLKNIIEDVLDPRDFIEHRDALQKAITTINEYLRYDGYEIIRVGDFNKVTDKNGLLIEPKTVKGLTHDNIKEQIAKCHKKIDEGDYSGAITNARSLVEAVMIEIIEQHEEKEIKNEGKIENLFKQVKKILNLNIDPNVLPPTVIQILSGFDSVLNGLAGLSNNSGDRHANKFKTRKHHARLAVNSTMTMVDFLLDSREFQNRSPR